MDFPLPLGPTMATDSPGRTRIDRPLRICEHIASMQSDGPLRICELAPLLLCKSAKSQQFPSGRGLRKGSYGAAATLTARSYSVIT